MAQESTDTRAQLDACIDAFAQRLPDKVGRFVRWISGGSSAMVRVPLALLLIAGGIVGFLPILGFWMVPLGLLLIALDVPFLRPPMIRLMRWINRKWPQQRKSN
jgi:hypothetical protein